MAFITIPSTIGGVTVPGTATGGPLGALFGSQYKLSNLQYPRDLGSMTKGHFVQFSLYQRKPQTYASFSSALTLANNLTADNAINFAESVAADVTGITKTAVTKLASPNSSALTYTPEVTAKPDIISLYMPDTVNLTNQSSYNGTSVMGAVQEAVGLASSVASKVPGIGGILGGLAAVPNVALSALNSNPAKLLLATQGLALNPKNQLLFEGIDFRSYQMSFTFTPYSAEEAETVRQIIKTFKKHAAPTIITEAAGMFFRPPSTVGVQFMFNGKENPNIAKVTESVIESIDVNYAPNGWSAHENGAPVQTVLTINFKEIQLVDSVMIDKQGF
jgi:hypothetical protein